MVMNSWSPAPVASAVSANATSFDADTDRADAAVVEVTLLWGDSTLAVRHVPAAQTLTLGDSDDCDVLMAGTADPVRIEHGATGVHVTPGSLATVSIDGWPRDLAPFDLGMGHHAEVVIDAFTIRLGVMNAGKTTPVSFADRIRQAGFGAVAVSFMVHASLVASLAYFLPSLGQDDSEAIDRDRLYAMKAMLDSAAAREQDRLEEIASEPSPANEGAESGGGRAQNAEGAMGRPDTRSQGHYAAKGDAKPNEVTLSRTQQLETAKNFGMIELLGLMPVNSATDAPTVPWDSVQNGMDDRNHRGNLFSQDLGDAFGFGLGLSGNEEGGGGKNMGIGINDIGGLGRSLASRQGGTCLTPPCDGMGRGSAPLRGGHDPKGPRMRVAKTEVEGGRLPAEVIQRIVRMSHGRFRNCYETGLRTNPSLGGRVAVRFVIGRDGSVATASDGGSDFPDEAVKQCVVQNFYSLSFPTPEGGTVRVTYPLVFSPSE